MRPLNEPPEAVMVPTTGEVIDLASAPTSELGRFLYEARDFESRAREAKAKVTTELLRRMDFDAALTLSDGDFVLHGDGAGPKTEWDAAALHEALTELVGARLIGRPAMEAALKREVTYKPQLRGIQALLKLGGEVADRVAQCGQVVDKQRRVRVERRG